MASLGILAGSFAVGALGSALFSKRRAESKATIENAIKRSVELVHKSAQTCDTSTYNAQKVTLGGTGNTTNNLNAKQQVRVSVKCIQQAVSDNDIKTKIQAEMEQAAKSITDAFGIGKEDAISKTITKFTTDLGTKILDAVSQTCAQRIQNIQEVEVKGKDNVNQDINLIQTVDQLVDCVSSNTQHTREFDSIMEKLKQQDDARAKGISMTGLLIIGAIVVFVMFGAAAGVLTKPIFLMILLVLIAFAVLYFMGVFGSKES
jgi:hypothetical protein